MNETDRSWLACVLDTDGCISAVRRRKNRIGVEFALEMTSRRFVQEFQRRAGTNRKIVVREPHKKEHNTTFRVGISKMDVLRDFLVFIEPELVIKRERARAAILYLDRRILRKGMKHDALDLEFFERIVHAKDQ